MTLGSIRVEQDHAAEFLAELRIAFLISAAEVFGSARQLVGTVTGLDRLGVPTRVVVTQRRGRPVSKLYHHLRDLGADCHLAEEGSAFDPGLIRTVRQHLEPWQPRVLETHGYKPHAVGYALRRMGAPWAWVGLLHGFTSENAKVRMYHQLGARLLRGADRIVVMSDQQRSLFGKVQDKVRVVYNSVLPLPESQGPGPDLKGLPRPRLGVVGRLSPEKGVDVFLDALAELSVRGFRFGAAVAGDGPERAGLERRCDALGLKGNVSFLGSVADMKAFYDQIDLLVIPSRSEGLPNVLLEALDEGVPVVSTRVGAVPDVMDGPSSGFLVEVGDAKALADVIEAEEWSGDWHKERERILRRFSNEEKVRNYLRVYREAMGWTPAGGSA